MNTTFVTFCTVLQLVTFDTSWSHIWQQSNHNHTLLQVRGKLIGYRIKYWREDLDEITESQYLLSRSVEPHALIIG